MILSIAGCANPVLPTPGPSLIAVPTQPPVGAGSPEACPAALLAATLVSHERWGLAVRDSAGLTRQVIWPNGYAGRRDGARLALIDAVGVLVAHEGDNLLIGGGEIGTDGAWLACGAISLATAG
jgi:hypothetical protein